MSRISVYYKNKGVIVAGGAGFVGSAIARLLLRRGAEVTVIDSLSKDCGGNILNLNDIKNEIRFIRADINSSKKALAAIKRCDVLFNCIGMTNHLKSNAEPMKDLEFNAVNHLRLLTLCARHNPAVRIVYLGSRSQYGPAAGKTPVKENKAMNPIDFHSAHKTLGEFYHNLFRHISGLNTVSLRIANVYGPGQDMRGHNPGILNYFVKEALCAGKIVIYGGRDRAKEFVYVDDAAEAAILAGAATRVQGSFNIGGNKILLAQAAETAIKAAGKGSLGLKPFPEKLKKIDTGEILIDSSAANNAFGWKPTTKLSDGLKTTVAYYLKYEKQYF